MHIHIVYARFSVAHILITLQILYLTLPYNVLHPVSFVINEYVMLGYVKA